MRQEELVRLCRTSEYHVREAIQQLKIKYDAEDSSLLLIEENNAWSLGVKETFLPLVRSIVAETELSKTILETLAIVAWRSPVLQAEVINIRTNKAYDHLRELEDGGFIMRTKKGRTQLIKLTDKFFKYFELDRETLKKRLSKIKETASLVDTLERRQRDTTLDEFIEPEGDEVILSESAEEQKGEPEEDGVIESEQQEEQGEQDESVKENTSNN